MTLHEAVDSELLLYAEALGVERQPLDAAELAVLDESSEGLWWYAYQCASCFTVLIKINAFTREDLFHSAGFKLLLATRAESHECIRRVAVG